MKTMPAIGTRVRYSDPESRRTPVLGTVVKLYPGKGVVHTDEETGDQWVSRDAVAVKVDAPLPAWWPYPGTDRFAPDLEFLEPANPTNGS